MCKRRIISTTFSRCDHIVIVEEIPQCDDRFCKFSTTHPSDCVPPQCTQSCWQYRQFPENYSLAKEGWCADCRACGMARY